MNYRANILPTDGTPVIIIAFFIGFTLFLISSIRSYLEFKDERDYIKMELSRSYEEEEYLYWEKELKDLYRSRIPIIGRFLK